jgi:hypothetical protein
VFVDRIVDGSSFNNLIKVIMNALLKGKRLTKENLAKKLFCVGEHGVNVFQGAKT